MPMFPSARYDLPPLTVGAEFDWAFRIKKRLPNQNDSIQTPADARLIVQARPVVELPLVVDGDDWLRLQISSAQASNLAAALQHRPADYRIEVRFVGGDWQRVLQGSWRVAL